MSGARVYPCHGCPLARSCTFQFELRENAKAAPGARRVYYDCPILDAEIRPGRRIEQMQSFLAGPTIELRPVRGTIVARAAGFYMYRAVMDAGQGIEAAPAGHLLRFRRPQPWRQIGRFLEEPDREVCKNAAIKLEGGGCDNVKGCACAQEAAPAAVAS